jgi:hypothetical protein
MLGDGRGEEAGRSAVAQCEYLFTRQKNKEKKKLIGMT